jgi:hypothetical protein
MPNLIKIGYTSRNDLNERIKELYSTGVPTPFECYYACQVEDGKRIEQILHILFKEDRVNNKREFFTTQPEKVEIALSLINPINVTPNLYEYLSTEESETIETNNRKRSANFTFSSVDIPIGSTLYFSYNLDITCIVYSDNTVMYNGEILTLTEAARNTGLISYKSLQGPRFWLFDDESLVSRRKRFEKV